MTTMTSGAAPCLGCGSEGGASYQGVPRRRRALCDACYQRALAHQEHVLYPLCGPRPVSYAPAGDGRDTWQPAPWGRVPFDAPPEALPARWQDCPPRLANRASARLHPEAHERTRDAETFAQKWLETHPQYLARWSTQEDRAA
jgi:hypothetical protein